VDSHTEDMPRPIYIIHTGDYAESNLLICTAKSSRRPIDRTVLKFACTPFKKKGLSKKVGSTQILHRHSRGPKSP
jgi:hypothetical protein